MAIYLSEILGGPEQIDKPFQRQADAFLKKNENYELEMIEAEDASVNVVFQYPGSLLQPDFVGIRTGRFSKKNNLLVVQVAVPADLLSSDRFVQGYGSLLKDAIIEAKKYFERKGIRFSLEDHIALADRVIEDLEEGY